MYRSFLLTRSCVVHGENRPRLGEEIERPDRDFRHDEDDPKRRERNENVLEQALQDFLPPARKSVSTTFACSIRREYSVHVEDLERRLRKQPIWNAG